MAVAKTKDGARAEAGQDSSCRLSACAGSTDGNHVLVKSVEQGAETVIFQHWINHSGKVCAEEA